MNAENPPQRIFVECSYTCLAGGRGGIRRVARNLANIGPAVSGKSLQVTPLVWGGIGFFAPTYPLSEKPHPAYRILYALSNSMRKVLSRFQAPPREEARGASAAPSLHAEGRLARLKQVFQHFRHSGELLYQIYGALATPPGLLKANHVRFQPGDIVVLVDSTWNSRQMLARLIAAQRTPGINLGVMVHDLFPLTLPEMCHADTITGYRRWFEIVASEADFFVTNSEATRSSLETYLCEHPELRTKTLQSGSFPLGADLDQAHRSTADMSPMRQAIRDLSGFVILAVGTIEPRKNYAAILDAFDLLSPRYPVSLAIVGRRGWKNLDVIERIATHPLRGSRLLHLDNASDTELAEAFSRAGCLVCASWAEGFGLPVVEGLMYRIPVLASDIPAFHEAGGTFCLYFPPDDPTTLAALIENVMADPAAACESTSADAPAWIDWEESTRQFSTCVLGLAKR